MAKRFLMWVMGAFVLVLFLCTFLPLKVMLIISGGAVLVGIGLMLTPFSLKQTLFACAISAIIAVMLYGGMQLWVHKLQDQLMNREQMIAGVITDLGKSASGKYTLVEIRLKEIDQKPLRFYEHFKINLYTELEEAEIGDNVSGNIRFSETTNDFGMGRESRVFICGFQDGEKLSLSHPDGFSLVVFLAKFRQNVCSRLSYGSQKTIGLLKSVCFGMKDSLDFDLYVSLKRIGLSHVMAVSGLHLSFAVMLIQSFLMMLGIDYRIRYIVNIFVCIFFTAIVGFPASCVRACVMLVLYSFAMAVGLFSDGLTSLSLAAFLLCLYNPLIVRDIGFLLSVTATAGIITMKLPIEHFLFPLRLGSNPIINHAYRGLTGIFSCSIAATVATLPVMIWAFGAVSIVAPFANVLLLSALELFFMAGILMIVFGWISPIGWLLGLFCDLLYTPIYWIANGLGKFRFASINHLDAFGILLVVILVGITAVSFYHYLRYHRRSFMVLLSLYVLFAFGLGRVYLTKQVTSSVGIHFVDVGQGDCTVITKGRSAVILDYGGSSSKRYQLIECLNNANITQVELLAFTHLHDDHTNGLQALLRNFYVDRIIYPYAQGENPFLLSLLEQQNAQLLNDARPIKVLGDVVIEPILDPSFSGADNDDNERCVCYRVSYGDVSVLVTGDLQGAAEVLLSEEQVDCSILKVSHHGSETSSFYPFLKAASPNVAIISVGENSYGLPDDSVIKRIESICPLIYSTRNEGTISFKTDGEIIERIFS